MTLLKWFEKNRPDIARKMQDRGTWDYKVFFPMNLEDRAVVTFIIKYGTQSYTGEDVVTIPLE